jgi:hypothetical protein
LQQGGFAQPGALIPATGFGNEQKLLSLVKIMHIWRHITCVVLLRR